MTTLRDQRRPGGPSRPGLRTWVALGLWLGATTGTAQVGPPVVPGFPNVPQTPGALLSGLNAPEQGRTAILAYHNGILFTVPEVPASQPGADFLVRTWDLANPSAPVETGTLGITPMPINAHGYLKSGEYLILGANWPPEAPWSFRADGLHAVERTQFPGLLCAGVRGCLFQPWFVGDTWWSYGSISGLATISRGNFNPIASWDHLGLTGVVGHPFLIGDLLIFASDQSRTGVATYDVSDPAHPVLLDVLTTGGPGGYWPEVWGGDGKLYVVFPYRTGGNGMRVVDATDPANLAFVADVPLPGAEAMYAQFQDEYAFIGDHKVDLRTFQSVLDLNGANAVRPNDGGVGVDTSQFALPLGNLLVTGGVGPNEGMAIWAHQAEPDTRGPSVGFHIPQAGRTHYPVGAPITLLIHETLESFTIVNGETFLVRPLGGAPIDGRLTFAFDDILTFTPNQPLAPNTTYEVVIPAGGIKDAAGNGIAGTSWTFSTGGSVGGNAAPAVGLFDATPYPAPPGEPVSFTAGATDPEGQPLEYRFDFGDGTPKTAWEPQGAAEHAYATSGHYRATVQVRDPVGAIASASRTVTVLVPPAGPRPTTSAQIVCDTPGRAVWTVNRDAGTVARLDADTLDVDFEVPACADPRSLALAATGELWVACAGDDRLRVLDGATGAPLASISTGYGSAPVGIAASPAGTALYVALSGPGELRRFDAASRAQTGAVAVGPWPRAVAVTPDGARILVTRFLSPRDWGEVYEVAAGSFTLTRTFRLHKLGGDGNRDGTAGGRGTPNYLAGIVVSPDGASAWVAANKPNVERGLLIGPDLDSDNTVRSTLVEIDLATNQAGATIDVDNSDSPSALAYSPFGDYLFVTLQGNDQVVVFDALAFGTTAGLGAQVTRLATGGAPQGLCTEGATNRLWSADFLGRTATVVEADPLLRAGEKNLASTAIATQAVEPLPPAVLAGKRIFYDGSDPRMSAEGYLSCASCHVDGGTDGRVWDFTGRGEGLRRTASLQGRAGMGQGNVHWSGNFDEIQDFENDIRFAFGGTGFLDESDFVATEHPLGPPKAGLSAALDALADYVSSLIETFVPRSPLRQSDGAMTPAAVAGRGHFTALGCASCHAAPRFTDSTVGAATLHDVGTLRTTSGGRLGGPLPGIDTPTLAGLWAAPPYFHDGSAPTLDDVFRVAGGEVIAAESGAPANGAQIIAQYVELNSDDTVRGRAYVELNQTGERVTFSGVDGGSGGTGALELRYSSGSGATAIEVRVNGVVHAAALPSAQNSISWWHRNWRAARLEGIPWNAGAANSVEVRVTGQFPSLSLDEILVSTADDLAAALPHRVALTLSPAERAELLAFLRQLDGSPGEHPEAPLFEDGFETGDTSRWDLESS